MFPEDQNAKCALWEAVAVRKRGLAGCGGAHL